jgi:hypothetical protein
MFLILRSTACSPVVGLMAVSGLLAFEAGDEAAGTRNTDVDGDATPEAPPFVAAAGRVNDIAAIAKIRSGSLARAAPPLCHLADRQL